MTRRIGSDSVRKSRVKIMDLADALNLSKGTISRALNGYPDISESTRLRVRNQAQRMGYVPLSSAQAIRTGRARALGLVLRVDSHDSHRAFLTDFLDGVSRAAGEQDWTLTVATATSEDDEFATLRRLTAERKADGFILPRSLARDTRIDVLRDEQMPFILYGRTQTDAGCSWFDVLGERAMQQAVGRFAALGHRRIGFVNGNAAYNYAGLREGGYGAGLAGAGLPVDRDLIMSGAMTPDQGEAATRALLALRAPPTAIVFALDGAALGAYAAARDLGLEIGRDLSVIGYDGAPEGRHADPALSTYQVDSRRAGERLATLLIDQIRGAEPEGLRETVEATFVARGSDGPPRVTSEDLAQKLGATTPHWEE